MQAPVIWITGLSGSGKSTLAIKIKEILPFCIIVDGDEIRRMLPNLGYSFKDRLKNALRICLIVKMINKLGYTVLCSTVSLFEVIHKLNRILFNNYFEVFLECDLEKLKNRKPTIYEKLDISFYQKPKFPHLKLNTDNFFKEEDVLLLCGIIQNLQKHMTTDQHILKK